MWKYWLLMTVPEHTFYVDNLFAYFPMQYVKTMYYLDVDFYWYYIGRQIPVAVYQAARKIFGFN